MRRHKSVIGWCVLWAALCAVTAGCSGTTHSSAAGVASSLATSTVIQQDTAQLESVFIANLQKGFVPAHPFKSVDAAVKATFPQGDTAKIEAYAVKEFTPADGEPGAAGTAARKAYGEKVVAYAISPSGGVPSPGSADIPGYQPTPSASRS